MATKKELRSKINQLENFYYDAINEKIKMIKDRLEDQKRIAKLEKKIEKLEEEIEKLKES